jgi:UDP-N-acetylglucosamine acyltransferase
VTPIHATAIVHPKARLAPDVRVGAYSIIDERVEIGAGSVIGAHVVVTGRTKIGQSNRIFPFSSIGDEPQDKKYKGEDTALEIGDGNTIREFCSLNRGTAQDTGVTRIGNDNLLMAYVHVAHDCHIGDHTVFANNTQLGGHVYVGDYAVLGGFTGVHQFCHVGAHCMTSVGSAVLQDLPPYVLAQGDPAKPRGINSRGLRRRGFSDAAILNVKRAFKTLYRNGLLLEEAKARLAEQAATQPELKILVAFIEQSTRGIMR